MVQLLSLLQEMPTLLPEYFLYPRIPTDHVSPLHGLNSNYFIHIVYTPIPALVASLLTFHKHQLPSYFTFTHAGCTPTLLSLTLAVPLPPPLLSRTLNTPTLLSTTALHPYFDHIGCNLTLPHFHLGSHWWIAYYTFTCNGHNPTLFSSTIATPLFYMAAPYCTFPTTD
jgi:hypothetical protein